MRPDEEESPNFGDAFLDAENCFNLTKWKRKGVERNTLFSLQKFYFLFLICELVKKSTKPLTEV